MSAAATRLYQVTIEDTLSYEITVAAADETAAQELAWEIFASDKRSDATRCNCEVTNTQQVQS